MNKQFTLIALTTITLSLGISSFLSAHSPVERQVSPPPTASQRQLKTIDASKISIGGLKLGMTAATITKMLGPPPQRQQEYDDICLGGYVTTLKYDRLEIHLVGNTKQDGRIHYIATTNRSYPTSEGVRVGDLLSKAQQTYNQFSSEQNSQYTLAYVSEGYGGLGFKASNGKIATIDLLATSC